MKNITIGLLINIIFVSSTLANNTFTTIDGKKIQLNKWAHIVFIDIWSSYQGQGPEKLVAGLPKVFNKKMQRIWVQPQMNVTKAQMKGYLAYFPSSYPLVLDESARIMRQYQVWQSPYHVVLKDGKVLFKGDNKQLQSFVKQI